MHENYQKIIQGCIRGDSEAFRKLVELYQAEIRAFIASAGTRPDFIDDIAQDVFLEAYRAFSRFDSSRKVDPWLRGIARNVISRYQRDSARQNRLRNDFVSNKMREIACEDKESSYGQEYYSALKGCLQKLPKKYHSLIKKRYHEGCEPIEIAHMIKTSAETVRVTMMRIRDRLRDCITHTLKEV